MFHQDSIEFRGERARDRDRRDTRSTHQPWDWDLRLDTSADRARDQQLQISPRDTRPYGTPQGTRQNSSSFRVLPPSAHRSAPSYLVFAGEPCPNRLDGLQCWEANWFEPSDAARSKELCDNLSAILANERGKLLKKRRRLPFISCGVFIVGRSEGSARPRFVISCDDSGACKLLRKIFKSEALHADYTGFEPLISTDFPRSHLPLQRLGGNWISDLEQSHTEHVHGSELSSDNLQPSVPAVEPFTATGDVFVRGSLLNGQTLVLPTQIFFGSSLSAPTAVLGGLIMMESGEQIYGVTVAHCSVDSAQHRAVEESDSEPGEAEASRLPKQHPSSDGKLKSQTTQGLTAIGSVAETSLALSEGQDWALVKLNSDLTLCTLAPYPTRLAQQVDMGDSSSTGRSQGVYIKTVQTLRAGSLLPNPYHILPPGEAAFLDVCTIKVDDPIHNGDCGSWVVGDQNQEFHGRIAFGHPGDIYAYMLPARLLFDQIASVLSDQPAICAAGPGFRRLFPNGQRGQASMARPKVHGRPPIVRIREGREISPKPVKQQSNSDEKRRSFSPISVEEPGKREKSKPSSRDQDQSDSSLTVELSSVNDTRQSRGKGKGETRSSPLRLGAEHDTAPSVGFLDETKPTEQILRREKPTNVQGFYDTINPESSGKDQKRTPRVIRQEPPTNGSRPNPPTHSYAGQNTLNYNPSYQAFYPPAQPTYQGYSYGHQNPNLQTHHPAAGSSQPLFNTTANSHSAPVNSRPYRPSPQANSVPAQHTQHVPEETNHAAAIERLEKLILEERAERVKRDAEAAAREAARRLGELQETQRAEWAAREEQLVEAAVAKTREAVREQRRVEEALKKARVRSACLVQ
ncbi:hypothetical protein BDW68DRAFT_180261 [Aspergillus falconensis]